MLSFAVGQALQIVAQCVGLVVSLMVIPPITVGTIRKIKARLQNRIGAPLFQPFFDLRKLSMKGETVSKETSWLFRATAVINLSIMLLLACLVPWLSFTPAVFGCDLFLIIYLFALSRFFTVLSALDSGSAFSGFGASREVTLALLVEPAIVLCLASLGVAFHSSDLCTVFSFTNTAPVPWILWFLAGSGLFLTSLIELSRMPVDDPTTHLELTMVHEAMILENSGTNLALIEYTHFLKLAVLLGLSTQCILHALMTRGIADELVRGVASLVGIGILALTIAVIESTAVKMRWSKVPEFIAYPVAISLLCMLIAVLRWTK